jgi:hypothetical protein
MWVDSRKTLTQSRKHVISSGAKNDFGHMKKGNNPGHQGFCQGFLPKPGENRQPSGPHIVFPVSLQGLSGRKSSGIPQFSISSKFLWQKAGVAGARK